MRLNADLISKTQQYLNPMNQFYIDLRGYKIPYLENLAATNDQFECVDLTENDIARLEELPKLQRLETLMLANNKVAVVEADFAEMCPKLDSLILTNNRLSRFEDIDMLATCRSLQRLSLIGNMVCNLPNYRLYTIHMMQGLRVLDFQMVSRGEREMARKLYATDDAPVEALEGEQNTSSVAATKVVAQEEEESGAAQQAPVAM